MTQYCSKHFPASCSDTSGFPQLHSRKPPELLGGKRSQLLLTRSFRVLVFHSRALVVVLVVVVVVVVVGVLVVVVEVVGVLVVVAVAVVVVVVVVAAAAAAAAVIEPRHR